MYSAFNAIFPPKTLVFGRVYLIIGISLLKAILRLQRSHSLSLFSLTPKTHQFEPSSRINTQ